MAVSVVGIRYAVDTSEFKKIEPAIGELKKFQAVSTDLEKTTSKLDFGKFARGTTEITTGLRSVNVQAATTNKLFSSNRDESVAAAFAMLGLSKQHEASLKSMAELRAKTEALNDQLYGGATAVGANMLAMGAWTIGAELAISAGKAWAGFVVDSIGEFDKQTGALADNRAAVKRLTDDWHLFEALVGGIATGGGGGATLIDGLASSFERLAPALAVAVTQATGLKELANFIRLVDSASGWIFGEGPKRRESIAGMSNASRPSSNAATDDQIKALVDGPKAFIAAIDKADKETKRAADAAKRIAEAQRKAIDELTGQNILDEAAKKMAMVSSVGGLQGVAPGQIANVHKVLDDALEVLAQRGQRASLAMADLWLKSMPTPAVIAGIDKVVNGLTAIAVVAPKVPLPNLPIAAGLGGQSVGGPSVPIGAFKAPSLMNQIMGAFGSVKDFGANLSNTIMGAFTGGGDVGKSIGALLGGGALSGVAKKAMGALGSKGLGGLLGGALGSVLPGLGNLLGSLGGNAISGLFGKLFGGEKKKTNQARDAYIEQAGGITELKKAAEEAGFSLDKMLATKKVKDFQTEVGKLNTAMDAHKNMLAGIDQVLSGVNARSSVFGETLKTASEKHASALADRMKTLGIDPTSDQGKALTTQSQAQFSTGHQAEFDRIGAMAVSSFGMQMQIGGSAIAALTAMAPTLAVLTEAQKQFNFAASETTQKLLDISTAVEANRPAFQALEADGQIVRGMLQGNLMNLSLFKAVSSDITSQIGSIVANGIPMSQALALSQPQLQGLWEAQQKFGFETDEATKALLEQATTQGIVGPQMKSVNDKILDVLLAIGKVLGADIPQALAGLPGAAQSAADGMNSAFGGVKAPVTGAYVEPAGPSGLEGAYTPEMAAGGIVRARPGGTVVRVGEAGQDEAIVPLGGRGGRVGSTHITINNPVVDNDARVEQLASAVARRIYQGGAVRTQWSRALQGLT
jgi:hypothetical protein